MFREIGHCEDLSKIVSAIDNLTLDAWNQWSELQELYRSKDTTLAYPLFFSKPTRENHYSVTIHNDGEVGAACRDTIVSLEKLYNSKAISAVFSSLKERSNIPIHVDPEYKNIHRVHIPIKTHKWVYMMDGKNKLYNWECGKIYELNATKPHAVINASRIDRIHLCVDIPVGQAKKPIEYETSKEFI